MPLELSRESFYCAVLNIPPDYWNVEQEEGTAIKYDCVSVN
jgi:hypothetical protein